MADDTQTNQRYRDLLLRHRQQVWRLCRKYAGYDVGFCADLVQEVSVALWERFDGLRPGASAYEEQEWVYWNARDVLSKIYRRYRRHVPTVPLADWMAESIADDRDAVRRKVAEMVAALPERERHLLQLWLDGYKADEIARMTGLARNTVYQRIYRIINHLKQLYHAE